MKQVRKKSAARKRSRATEVDLPEFLKTLISGMQKEESMFSRVPALRFYTYDQMLDITAGFSDALMHIHSAENNSFETERDTLLIAEILNICAEKYEISPGEIGVLLFHVATQLLLSYKQRGGDGAPV